MAVNFDILTILDLEAKVARERCLPLDNFILLRLSYIQEWVSITVLSRWHNSGAPLELARSWWSTHGWVTIVSRRHYASLDTILTIHCLCWTQVYRWLLSIVNESCRDRFSPQQILQLFSINWGKIVELVCRRRRLRQAMLSTACWGQDFWCEQVILVVCCRWDSATRGWVRSSARKMRLILSVRVNVLREFTIGKDGLVFKVLGVWIEGPANACSLNFIFGNTLTCVLLKDQLCIHSIPARKCFLLGSLPQGWTGCRLSLHSCCSRFLEKCWSTLHWSDVADSSSWLA